MKAFHDGKDVFALFLTDWYRSIVSHCANKKPRTVTNPLKWHSKSDWSAWNTIDRRLILIAFLLLFFSLKGLPFPEVFKGIYIGYIYPIYLAQFDKAGHIFQITFIQTTLVTTLLTSHTTEAVFSEMCDTYNTYIKTQYRNMQNITFTSHHHTSPHPNTYQVPTLDVEGVRGWRSADWGWEVEGISFSD